MRRIATIPIIAVALCVISALGWSGSAQASSSQLNYQISDARAYGYKASIAQPVIQAAPKCAQNPEAQTETDAFSNLPKYEERCYETGSNGNYDPKASSHAKPGDSYAHMFSHSQKGPETDAYTECFQSQCQFNTAPLSPAAAHGLTQVHLQQTGDTVRGVLSAELEDLNFGNGGFVIK